MSGDENIWTIAKIEGSLCEASKNLDKLSSSTGNQEALKQAAIEELQDFQTETLHALRILFE